MKYNVYVDGKEIVTNPARVSAIPFNMVWNGYQRDIAQTEIAWFVTFDMSKPVEIKVDVLDAKVEEVKIRPLEFGIDYTVCDNTITIKLDSPKKFTVEVNGVHETLHVFANEPDDFVPDENTIYFGPGEHEAGLICPESGQTVYIAEGAVVYGGIFAYKVDNVTVRGRGILDSSKMLRGAQLTSEDEVYKKLKSINFNQTDIGDFSSFVAYGCNNFKVEGIILKDAPFWAVIIRNGCRDVDIRNIKIIGQWRYNSDGVDLCASQNVVLSDCFIRSFDDGIVVRAVCLENETYGCENMLIENNIVWCDWGKNLEIWNGNKNSIIKDIVFKNSYLIHSVDKCISIDTWYGAPSIVVENVTYENVYIDTDADSPVPCIQQSKEHEYPYYGQKGENVKSILVCVSRVGKDTGNQGIDTNVETSHFRMAYRNIAFKNIVCNSERLLPAVVDTGSLYDTSNITFENCRLGKLSFMCSKEIKTPRW